MGIIQEQQQVNNNEASTEIVIGDKIIEVDKIEVSKQMLWERKLLDLTLRNNLLNLRVTKVPSSLSVLILLS